ncbi:hypothetical protein C8J56DRAFT_1079781 [Mycena floridula]|nr:hypothetical protein C8J56DRAFT_1079781 [Mycena floridula]
MSEDCTADIQRYLRSTGQFIMNAGLSTIAETVFWTLYVVSVVVTVCVLWRKGLNRARTALLFLIGIMFVIDTMCFSLDLYVLFYHTRVFLLGGMFEGDAWDRASNHIDTANALHIILALFILIPGDCIVMWRAHAVWTRSRIIMIIPVLFLLGSIVNFPIFLSCNIKHQHDPYNGLGAVPCFATSVSAWVLSFCTNISATLMIFYTAWSVNHDVSDISFLNDSRDFYASQKHLRDTTTPLRRNSLVARVLLLLIESGFVYLLLMVLSIALDLAPTYDYGPSFVVEEVLNTILTPHCAAMIPTLTILLVNLYGSFEEYSTVNFSQPIHFANPGVTELTQEFTLSRPVQRESDAEANDSHSSNSSQERKM